MVKGILPSQSRHPAVKVYRFGANPDEWCEGEGGLVPPHRSWPLGRRSGCSSALPYPPPRPNLVVARARTSSNLPCGLPRLLPPLTCSFELAVSLVEDHLRQSVQFIGWRDVPD